MTVFRGLMVALALSVPIWFMLAILIRLAVR